LTGSLGASTLAGYMRRKAVHLMAAIVESLRFIAIAFLAFDLGLLLNPSVSSLLRYAAAPQLLFAAGFFFLWLDPSRYGSYRPLLLIGKVASVACLLPLARSVAIAPGAASFGLPFLAIALIFFIGAVDIASISILALAKPEQPHSVPGQGVDDIERVEGL
jgi:hypothetical protein